jgi:hypothetical protein
MASIPRRTLFKDRPVIRREAQPYPKWKFSGGSQSGNAMMIGKLNEKTRRGVATGLDGFII